jgi:hypothetical protein
VIVNKAENLPIIETANSDGGVQAIDQVTQNGTVAMIGHAKLRTILVAAAIILAISRLCHAEVIRTRAHVVIDGVEIPYGTVVEIVGTKQLDLPGSRLGCALASIRGIRINGRAIDGEIDFQLCDSQSRNAPSVEAFLGLRRNAYYRVQGRLVDAVCDSRGNKVAIIVTRIEPLPPAPLSLADFVNRHVHLEGTAAADGRLAVGSEFARLDGLMAWPHRVAKKHLAVRGVIRGAPGNWRIEAPQWNLLDLSDQVGQEVTIEGTLWSTNDCWRFQYRNDNAYLVNESGFTLAFPSDDFGGRIRVSGRLVRQDRPSLDQTSLNTDYDLVPCFVVRGAQISYLEEQIPWPRKFTPLYATYYTTKDGVPELLPDAGCRQFVGNETMTRLYVDRNNDVITDILRNPTPQTLDVLARRMESETVPRELRLIYAAMLARVNDERGRSFLLKSLANRPAVTDVEAIFCLGEFASLAPELTQIKTETHWAEKTLVGLFKDHTPPRLDKDVPWKRDDLQTVADAVANYTDIALLLMRNGSEEGRNALVDYVVGGGILAPEVVAALCHSDRALPVADLLKLERVTKYRPNYPVDVESRRLILIQLLRNKHPAAATRFVHELENDRIYMTFRKNSSSGVIAALRPLIPEMTGQSRENAQMLVTLNAPDPVPALIALLEDAAWKGKNLAMFELARLRDPRAVMPVSRILRSASRDYFDAPIAVEHALEAITNARTAESIDQLIELLPVDLARFGKYIDRAGLQRIVAAHLIELTGESFGVDEPAWRAWRRSHSDSPPAHP